MSENVNDTATTEAAVAIPTKQFFVSMLTRDITLADAILDLLDNCLDGALRLANGGDVDYSRHFVRITLSKDSFEIEDNCGGIPRDVAKNYAFKMGRETDDHRDTESETIGMYGVGMKRAIFKMGRSAKVNTRHLEDAFEVPITSDWLDDKDWKPLPILDMVGNDRLSEPGTKVSVTTLYPGVSRHFTNDGFLNELRTSIAEHFTLFLQRGLRVEVNTIEVEPVHVELLVSKGTEGPAPFVFQKTIDDVVVSIVVGLNTGRGLASDEDDGPDFERDRSVATAGWTVFCNDRAVIVGDKSRLTGWGDGIPLYHYQFSILTGIVEFRSKHAEKLPVTTTKRALDTSSDVWLQALVKMKEGMRIWISYTNNWKNHPRSDQTRFWKDTTPMPLRGTIDAVAERAAAKRSDGHIEYNPQKQKVIPVPETQKPSSRRIVFSRPIEEIRVVSKALFDSPDEAPGIIGDKCFELALRDVVAVEEGGNE
ncbi:ATP-binding protein [Rhizobium leguminosarum]|uniref:ATP-binding protein n=1 Tax=Rhizobium leguminosarum TaxID=384 RepID=UPI000688EF14|nr:ATP-binding protein [Rhizobium leguminosarum]